MHSAFKTGKEDRYFEDYEKGAVFEYGPISVSESDIVAFAKQFDPQSMHTDPAAAAAGPFEGLIASGWHMIALMMRLLVDNYLTSVASLASPGVDELRWIRPVRPGDELRLRIAVIDSKPSRSKPDRGIVYSMAEAINQEDVIVATFKVMNMIGRRK